MNYVDYINTWAKNELIQGRIMIGVGILVLLVFYFIIRSHNDFLKGGLIPLGIMFMILLVYGSYILYSRPAHVKESITLYKTSKIQAIEREKEKHINDNKAGKVLMKYIYPIMMIFSVLAFILVHTPYHKAMALGFLLLAISAYIIDYGFVSRSDTFLSFLNKINEDS